MPCSEFLKIQSVAEAAREQLRGADSGTSASEPDELFPPSWKRAAQTALFSAEIDLAFHKSRCEECGGATPGPEEADLAATLLIDAA